LSVAILSAATVMRASVPIIVATPARMRAAMKLVTDAQDQLQNGDAAGAKRNADAALHNDPTFWPALYVRAQIYSREGKYELALKRVLPDSTKLFQQHLALFQQRKPIRL